MPVIKFDSSDAQNSLAQLVNSKSFQCQPWKERHFLAKKTVYEWDNNILRRIKTIYTSKTGNSNPNPLNSTKNTNKCKEDLSTYTPNIDTCADM